MAYWHNIRKSPCSLSAKPNLKPPARFFSLTFKPPFAGNQLNRAGPCRHQTRRTSKKNATKPSVRAFSTANPSLPAASDLRPFAHTPSQAWYLMRPLPPVSSRKLFARDTAPSPLHSGLLHPRQHPRLAGKTAFKHRIARAPSYRPDRSAYPLTEPTLPAQATGAPCLPISCPQIRIHLEQ